MSLEHEIMKATKAGARNAMCIDPEKVDLVRYLKGMMDINVENGLYAIDSPLHIWYAYGFMVMCTEKLKEKLASATKTG